VTQRETTQREATVLWGANNIFSLRCDDGTNLDHVRIKGKVLPDSDDSYNVLAPGDRVLVSGDDTGKYTILERQPRRNAVTRWNRKRQALQTVAANVDHLYVVGSAEYPAYHPGFVDRILVMAELEEVNASVILNKTDLTLSEEAAAHITVLEEIGYTVLRAVAHPDHPQGIEDLLKHHPAGTAVFFGESGVGKSSLINLLAPGAMQETGEVSIRYDRGRHTTTLARHISAGGRVFVDTPGVRHYPLDQYEATEIAAGFREFRSAIVDCRMPSCTHLHEPDCAVLNAVERGEISPIRYESYVKIIREKQDHS